MSLASISKTTLLYGKVQTICENFFKHFAAATYEYITRSLNWQLRTLHTLNDDTLESATIKATEKLQAARGKYLTDATATIVNLCR